MHRLRTTRLFYLMASPWPRQAIVSARPSRTHGKSLLSTSVSSLRSSFLSVGVEYEFEFKHARRLAQVSLSFMTAEREAL